MTSLKRLGYLSFLWSKR